MKRAGKRGSVCQNLAKENRCQETNSTQHFCSRGKKGGRYSRCSHRFRRISTSDSFSDLGLGAMVEVKTPLRSSGVAEYYRILRPCSCLSHWIVGLPCSISC